MNQILSHIDTLQKTIIELSKDIRAIQSDVRAMEHDNTQCTDFCRVLKSDVETLKTKMVHIEKF